MRVSPARLPRTYLERVATRRSGSREAHLPLARSGGRTVEVVARTPQGVVGQIGDPPCTTICHFLRAPRRIVGQVFNLRRIFNPPAALGRARHNRGEPLPLVAACRYAGQALSPNATYFSRSLEFGENCGADWQGYPGSGGLVTRPAPVENRRAGYNPAPQSMDGLNPPTMGGDADCGTDCAA